MPSLLCPPIGHIADCLAGHSLAHNEVPTVAARPEQCDKLAPSNSQPVGQGSPVVEADQPLLVALARDADSHHLIVLSHGHISQVKR